MERRDLTFTDAVKSCFNQFANFSGRARRQEYWYFALFIMIVDTVLITLERIIFGADSAMANALYRIINLVVFAIPYLAVTWRRLHDVDKSGAYYLFVLIPFIGWIIVLIQLCKDSQPGENRFGVSPKYPNAS